MNQFVGILLAGPFWFLLGQFTLGAGWGWSRRKWLLIVLAISIVPWLAIMSLGFVFEGVASIAVLAWPAAAIGMGIVAGLGLAKMEEKYSIDVRENRHWERVSSLVSLIKKGGSE